MGSFVSKFFRKSTFIAVAVALMSVGVISLATTASQPQTASADTCKSGNAGTDIIYNGLGTSSDPNTLRQSLQKFYTQGYDYQGCNSDLKAVYDKVYSTDGGTGSLATILNSSDGWEVGYTNSNGTITDSQGNVIATDTVIGSRCFTDSSNCGAGYTKFYGNYVDTHAPSTYFTADGKPAFTLYHVNKDGVIDFALWRACGNFLIFTHVTPKSLSCQALEYTPVGSDVTTFTLTATVIATGGAQPVNYSFYYSTDSNFKQPKPTLIQFVSTNALTVTTKQFTLAQAQTDTTYYLLVLVGLPSGMHSSLLPCKNHLVVPAQTVVKSLVCSKLDVTHDGATYTFTAHALATNTTIDTYTFDFGDGVKTAPQTSNVAVHTYTVKKAIASVVAAGPLGTTPANPLCTASIELAYTGPGDTFGIFAGASVFGVVLHQLVLRRKLAL